MAGHSDEPVDLNYADHEFLNTRIEVRQGEGGGNADRGVEYQIESDVLDLENDELGMLAWMNASMSVTPEGFPETGGEVTKGSAQVQAEIGANLSGNEFIAQSSRNTGVEEVDGESSVVNQALVATDEPGLWGHLNAACISGFKDADADGVFSGQGSPDNDRIRRVYGEETSGGPYIDSTDDVNVGIWIQKDDFETALRVVVYAQMAFVVFEYENRRQEFAPYDPA